MSEQQTTAKTRREIFLTVALAVADGLPEPRGLTLYDRAVPAWNQDPAAVMKFETHADATAWAEWLDCLRSKRTQVHEDGRIGVYYYGDRGGWAWSFDAIAAVEDAAPEAPGRDTAAIVRAALVAEAALTPDSPALPDPVPAEVRPPRDDESESDYASYLWSTRTQAGA